MEYTFLAFLSIILLLTQLMGKASKRINLPTVVGALVAGVLLGPSVFDWVKLDGTSGGFVEMAAEIGVVMLMFTAGLETDLKELKSSLISSLTVAAFGVIVPLIGGFLSYFIFFKEGIDYYAVLKSVFMGVVLTATSVSITVETLREMGKADGKAATTILGAAVIDDILGVIVLSVITSLKEPSAKISTVLFNNILCFLSSVALIWIVTAALKKRGRLQKTDRTAVVCSLALLAGCGFGAKLTGCGWKESLQIGTAGIDQRKERPIDRKERNANPANGRV